MNKILTGLIASAIMSLSLSAHADWSFKGLGTSGDASFSQATAINDLGVVTGTMRMASDDSSKMNSFLFDTNSDTGMYVFLGNSFAMDINNLNEITGWFNPLDGSAVSAFVTSGSSMRDLGPIGESFTSPNGINRYGEIVGHFIDSDSIEHAFIINKNGSGLTDLGTLGGNQSVAQAINNVSQVTGWSSTDENQIHAFLTFENGKGMKSIGTLGGDVSQAFDINDSANIVGSSTVDSKFPGSFHAFLTGDDGKNMIDLGTLGGRSSAAYAINNSDEVVGVAQIASGEYHSFIYSHGGITDLSILDPVIDAGWTNLSVLDINNKGQMVGHGINNQGQTEAFLLSYTENTVFNPQDINIPPIPEPSTYLMLLAGLGVMRFFGFRSAS